MSFHSATRSALKPSLSVSGHQRSPPTHPYNPATIPLALNDALVEGRIKSGDKVLIAGFGSGLTWGACLLEWE